MNSASAATLAARLYEGGSLPAGWAAALDAVPREQFIPHRMWVDEGGDDEIACVAIDRSVEPDRWLDAVYSNRVIVTQFDDGETRWPEIGYRPSCSSSMPSAVLGMLNLLDVGAADTVLEIGAGTGWNAALLAQRAGTVTTVEVDPTLAEQARSSLRDVPNVQVVAADGATGYRAAAPFDRVVATASVRLGQFPYEWVAQTRPGGVVLAPLRADMTSGPLVKLTVAGDGTARGRIQPMRVSFMELRSHRMPARWDRLRWDDPDADLTHTDLQPWVPLLAEASQWAIAVALPQCRFDVWKRTPERGHGVAWLVDTSSASWASVVPAEEDGRFDVRQHGPRRLWNEAEAAYRWWQRNGEPPLESWELTVAPDQQSLRLAT